MKEVASAGGASATGRDLEPFDPADPRHRAALRAVASTGVGLLGGTEAVLAKLRSQHHLRASTATAFDGLALAAELERRSRD